MKYIKKFENYEERDPKVGCYAIFQKKNVPDSLNDFFKTHIALIIGKYESIDERTEEDIELLEVEYDKNEIPDELQKFFRISPNYDFAGYEFEYKDIIDWSEIKEELELGIAVKQYNL